MPVRFRKIIRITPWLRMNISKGGVSFTVGKKGYHVNVSDEGVKQTIGLPGTGLSYQSYAGRDEDDDKKKENGNGNGHSKQDKDNGHEKSGLGELGSVAGMAILAEVLDHDKDDKDEEKEEMDEPHKRSRRRRRKAGPKSRGRSSGLRSIFILAAILVFFLVGATVLGLIPADFFANLWQIITRWIAQLRA